MNAFKEQTDFFKTHYDEENNRSNILTKRDEIYFSIISLFLTAVLFKIKDIFDYTKDIDHKYLIVLLCTGLISFSASLLLVVYSLKIRDFKGVIDIDDFIKKNNEGPQENEDFFRDRVADYIVAIKRNTKINNKKAGLLIKSGVFILSGLLFTVIFIITLLLLKT